MSSIQASRARKPGQSPGGLTATGLFMRRTLHHMRNNIFGLAVEAVLSPIIMLLIFTFLFGGAIAGSAWEYIQYLLPGILVLTVVPMTVYSGTTICTDIAKGVYHRFRTLPFWQPAAIFGSIIADSLRYAVALLVVLTMGFGLGFRPDGGLEGTMAAALYVLLFAFGTSWVFALIGNAAKRPDTVSGTSMMIVYPLLFASNVLVDTSTMPRWLQVAIDLNPISIVVTLTRGLLSGTAGAAELAAGIGVVLLFIVIFAPLTISIYLRRQIRG
ncbi:ABC transporter permease [Paenibacillus lactis]|uniref:Transport permease protein n=1 Tax=Paenibacillus lactis 154 TaxID=743719 RepID=G4HK10_9BACL|nr:ABC transporter permease [Paenibacillus lactis]EHB62394.1 ABC-2 type transporter [Paenibacillus lactis 154]GIO90171.1 transport permease protein [Paenibacillus lactis]